MRRGVSLGWLMVLALVGVWPAPAAAHAAPATKAVRYHGYRLVVPSEWSVYHLHAGAATCVRFDRHAVYLGQPGAAQNCPPHSIGRTEAILVQPLRSEAGRAGRPTGEVLPQASVAAASPAERTSAHLVDVAHGVVVTATWNHDPAVIQRALGVRSLAAASTATAPATATGRAKAATDRAAVRATADAAIVPTTLTPTTPTGVYTGLGFDACATPSSAQMSAWGASPFRAIGVYIGGTNMACSQANLTSTWVSQQITAGWHLIPIYVGLQAPSNTCGCASISSASAASQGAAAAQDAVVQGEAVGLGAGQPIYDDMEGYTRTTSNTSAVLAFLAAWTAQLHASGYQSGVYSSDDSGIEDLVAQVGTGYQEPDDIWIANWNGAPTTSDPNVPSADWAGHQRLHQYQGGHNETYGGVTINVDRDYLDGATAGTAGVVPAIVSAPALSVSPDPDGDVSLHPSWTGGTPVSSWQVLGGASPSSLDPVANPVRASARPSIVLHSEFAYFAVRALGAGGQTLASSAPVATPAHLAIFGKSAFVSPRGIGGVPVACFGVAACRLTTTISAGARTLVRTGQEQLSAGGGLAYFHFSPAARAVLAQARRHQLLVRISVRAASGQGAARPLRLIAFASSGPSPHRSVTQSSALRIIGTTDFVAGGRFGGILAGCLAATPCHTGTTIVAAGKVVARTKPETLGVNELGYLFFSLTPEGRRMLIDTHGNQLPAKLTISAGAGRANARIALAAF